MQEPNNIEDISPQKRTQNQVYHLEHPTDPIPVTQFQVSQEPDYNSKLIHEIKKGILFQGSGKGPQYVVSKETLSNQIAGMKNSVYIAKFQIKSQSGQIDFGIVDAGKAHQWGKVEDEDYISKDVIGQQFYNHMFLLKNNNEKSNNFFPKEYIKNDDVVWVELDLNHGTLQIYMNGNKSQLYVNHENHDIKIKDGSWKFFFRLFDSKSVIKVEAPEEE